MKERKNWQIEIPDGVRKLMEENPELKQFIETLLDYNKLLEKKIRELQKNYRMLERAVDELLGPNAMKWGDKPRLIQVRSAPKEARKANTIEVRRANHKGVSWGPIGTRSASARYAPSPKMSSPTSASGST